VTLRTVLVAAIFLLSGACALVFETLWFHQAALALGNTVWAASLVLSAFMAGMAIGNALAARFGDRLSNGLLAYAGLEVLVAAVGTALVYWLPSFGAQFARLALPLDSHPALLGLLRFSGAFGLLLLPSLAMGLTLPLLVRAVSGWDDNYGRVLGVLYGANTVGATLGAASCEVFFIEHFGIRGSAVIAGSLNVTAALLAWFVSRTRGQPVATHDSGRNLSRTAAVSNAGMLLSATFIAGALLLCLEVIWLRFLTLFLNDTPLAFALVLALVLAGIAIGSLLASMWSSFYPRAFEHAYVVAYAGGLLGFFGYLLFPKVLQGSFPPYQSASTILRVGTPIIFPTSLASGALFALLGAYVRNLSNSDSGAVGRLSLANTIGSALGSLLGGFVLLPRLGMELSLLITLGAYGVVGTLLAWRSPSPLAMRFVSTAAFVVPFAFFPVGKMRDQYIQASARRWAKGEGKLVGVREGTTATMLHVVHHRDGVPLFDQIATNAYSMSVNGWFGRRYMKLFVYLPLAVHPRIHRALVIGYGIGNTAQALTDSAELETIDIVDASREMLDQSRFLKVAHGRSPLQDSRVHVHIEDGRFFLQGSSASYDLITGEPPPPIMAGVVHLYTSEYFRMMRARLAPGGIATYWLPVINISAATTKSLIASFCTAFPDCSLWHGAGRNLMLMGTRDARGPVDELRFTQQWRTPEVLSELLELGFELPEQLGALFIGDASYLRALTSDALPLTDDQPGRMQSPLNAPSGEELLTGWRDGIAARERFRNSATVTRLLPAAIRERALVQFDVEWLLNELLSPDSSLPRDTTLLNRVLRGTRLRLPVLLILRSDPDAQRAAARLPLQTREQPQWLVHRAIGHLADRDPVEALTLLERVPVDALPMAGLRDYVEVVAEQQQARRDVDH
jgi:predicted membrane-bound spermidine synthase